MTRDRRTPGLSAPISGERQGGHSRAQSPRVAEEVRSVAYPLEKFSREMASSGSVPSENRRLALFGGLFHRFSRVVASRLPPRPTTGDPLRVVLRVQPRGGEA